MRLAGFDTQPGVIVAVWHGIRSASGHSPAAGDRFGGSTDTGLAYASIRDIAKASSIEIRSTSGV
jgi:hypothetical protein